MGGEKYYLKQNVLVEPLINQWYAWSYLMPPATGSMYMANQHLKILQSFVSAPQVHVSALRNPAMLGGPFINYGADKVPEIKSLIERTLDEQADLLSLADAIKKFDELLQSEAAGYSLEPLYQKAPDPLRGYFELVYDLNNHPSIRFIEGLLYRSEYYKDRSQSIALSIVEGDHRSFVFSTPRLETTDCLNLKVPFASDGLDELFKMKQAPQSLGYIKEILGVQTRHDDLFSGFFTEEGAAPSTQYCGEGVRIRYFGHACLLVESKDVSILCDPLIAYKYDNGISRYSYADLPDTIDYALITHNHQDHCLFETLLQLRHKVKHIVVPRNNSGGLADPSLKLVLQRLGFRNVIELDDMEMIEVDGGHIMGLPFLGEHGDLNIRTKSAYLINLNGKSILAGADSNNIDSTLYRHIHDGVGDIDILFIGMECDGAPLSWIYGPLLTRPLVRKMDQTRRFDGSDCEKAISILNHLKPRQVYVYAMGQEPWLTYLTAIQYTEQSKPIVESNKLIQYCRSQSMASERLFGQKEIIL